MTESSRQTILDGIGHSELDAASRDYARIAQAPRSVPEGVPSERFAHRACEYGASVETIAAADIPAWVTARGPDRVLVGRSSRWSSEGWAVVDDGASNATMDEIGGALVEAAGAAGDTGTLILDGRADDARRALSLIPDKLICVVRIETIHASLEEWWQHSQPDRPITLISGPSATSDIELNRVVGVHGPRQLHVLVLR